MVIIKTQTGWCASNEASIHNKKYPNIVDGKTQGFFSQKECHVVSPYIVSGSLEGKVKIAIKDDVSGVVSCFDGECITPTRIRITNDCDNTWLKTIK